MSAGRATNDPVDAHVGARIRLRRKLLGMGQEELATGLGLTFQQVQKYERGTNRVSASRLYHTARILSVPISFFFEGLDESDVASDTALITADVRLAQGTGFGAVDEIVREFGVIPTVFVTGNANELSGRTDPIFGKPFSETGFSDAVVRLLAH